jgi:hypothetical protein
MPQDLFPAAGGPLLRSDPHLSIVSMCGVLLWCLIGDLYGSECRVIVPVGVLVEIGTKMPSMPNSRELIEVLDNCKLDKHRLDVFE